MSILIILAVLVIVFISPITKYAIEKYAERYTGRQITMDWAYVNPFTGYIKSRNYVTISQNHVTLLFQKLPIFAV